MPRSLLKKNKRDSRRISISVDKSRKAQSSLRPKRRRKRRLNSKNLFLEALRITFMKPTRNLKHRIHRIRNALSSVKMNRSLKQNKRVRRKRLERLLRMTESRWSSTLIVLYQILINSLKHLAHK